MQVLARETVVIRSLAKVISFIILVFAFYIQFHGKISPGGGFQAGIVLAMFFIFNNLIAVCTSHDALGDRLPTRGLRFLAIIGMLLYFLAAACFSANILDYGVVLETDILTMQQKKRQIGVFIVEIGIGVVVFAAMLLIYRSLRTFVLKLRYSLVYKKNLA